MIRDIIVQAGGKGARMGHYTKNRPKCLISINGVNFLQSIHHAFPSAKLHIIGDYKFDVLNSYLKAVDLGFDYSLIKANGQGTNAGLAEALQEIDSNNPLVITWSDLFYTEPVEIPDENFNYIGISNSNPCRYKFYDNTIIEQETRENGIIGFFFFKSPSILRDIPSEGEFVKYLSLSKIEIKPLVVDSIIDLGTLDRYEEYKLRLMNSRFFNKITIDGERVVKEARTNNFSNLINDEINWYNYMNSVGVKSIPKIYNLRPLVMEKIESSHPFLIKKPDKAKIISKIIDELENLHKISSIKANLEDMYEMYVNKTLKRIEPVTKYLNLNKNSILVVNNIRVEPILPSDTEIVEKMYKHLSAIRYFTPIHGDPTFSNIFVSNGLGVKFIDPRGSFGKQKIYGDPRYDFAKLYYSAIGNYDQFNLKNFRLEVDGNRFTLSINSSGFEETEIIFRTRLKSIYSDIKILHALIWLSLSGYLFDDIDAMVAAYVHGLELTRRCIDEIRGF